jgi:hypothetical protein
MFKPKNNLKDENNKNIEYLRLIIKDNCDFINQKINDFDVILNKITKIENKKNDLNINDSFNEIKIKYDHVYNMFRTLNDRIDEIEKTIHVNSTNHYNIIKLNTLFNKHHQNTILSFLIFYSLFASIFIYFK